MKPQKGDSLFWGMIILIIGTLFLLHNMGMELNVFSLIGTFWPVILILIGLKNIWLHFKKEK